jgi:arabinofuranosyltransferase
MQKSRSVDLMLLALACLAGLVEYRFLDPDDGVIVYRVVRNLLEGYGWSFNPGEQLNVVTSALNTCLIWGLSLLLGQIPLAAHIVGSLAILAAGAAFYQIISADVARPYALIAALLLCVHLSGNQTWGLETNLFIALSILIMHPRIQANRLGLWSLAGFLVLTRPDGCLMALMLGIRDLYTRPRKAWSGWLLFLAIQLPWLCFSTLLFGSPLPSTLANKVWQGGSGLWGEGWVYLQALSDHLLQQPRSWWPLYLAAAFAAGRACFVPSPWRLMLLFAAGQQIVYAWLNVPGYHWYFSFLDAAILIVALHEIGKLLGDVLPVITPKLVPTVTAAALPVLFLLTWQGWRSPELDMRKERYSRAMAIIEDQNLPDGALAAVEAGTIGFSTRRRIVDLCGLTSTNPEYLSGRNNDRFFSDAPLIVLLRFPSETLVAPLMTDSRFALTYGEPKLIRTGAKPMQYFVRRQ